MRSPTSNGALVIAFSKFCEGLGYRSSQPEVVLWYGRLHVQSLPEELKRALLGTSTATHASAVALYPRSHFQPEPRVVSARCALGGTSMAMQASRNFR